MDIRNLKISFDSERSRTDAVKGISFCVGEDEAVAVVGESGSGKSVTAMSLTRLLPPPPLCRVGGKIIYRGADVAEMSESELRKIRGREIAYIFHLAACVRRRTSEGGTGAASVEKQIRFAEEFAG